MGWGGVGGPGMTEGRGVEEIRETVEILRKSDLSEESNNNNSKVQGCPYFVE